MDIKMVVMMAARTDVVKAGKKDYQMENWTV